MDNIMLCTKFLACI